MTNEEYGHGIGHDFTARHAEKFAAGVQHHGGNIWEKPCMLKEAEDELIDQWSYLETIRYQLGLVLRHLEKARLEENLEEAHKAEIVLSRIIK